MKARRNSVRTKALYEEMARALTEGASHGGCVLCVREPIKEYKHWKTIENHFPYDRVTSKQVMLIPKRHIVESELNDNERAELLSLKGKLDEEFDGMWEPFGVGKSLPDHYHIHLWRWRDTFVNE